MLIFRPAGGGISCRINDRVTRGKWLQLRSLFLGSG